MSGTGPDQKPEKPKTGTKKNAYSPAFEEFWIAYPRHPNMSKAEAFTEWQKLDEAERAACHAAVPGYIAFLKTKPDLETIHACRFISKRRFEGYSATVAHVTTETWTKRLKHARSQSIWATSQWGPMPGEPNCLVPSDMLREGDGEGWKEWEQAA